MLKVQNHITKLLFLAGGLLALFSACSPDSTGFFSKGYHNTTARYNAYFLAQQKLQEVEAQIEANHQRNFNQLLYIYPQIDTVEAKQYQEALLEAMKTASLAIERHKNSKWLDDSYLLIGKARYWGKETEQAVETFKFVNTQSKDNATRHRALIYLMRTFIDDGQLSNAKGVADYLRKEELNKENQRDYHLVNAQLYRERQEWETMAEHLEKAVADTRKRDGRAKYHFILGQLYQGMEQEEKAYEHFRKVLRSDPDYELSFFARLHMAQVANLANEANVKEVRRYFSKLLKDRKNKEYRDKIYYELANVELRQGNLEAAIDNYKKSIRASVNNQRQKSYAYRSLAELYYTAGNYKLSKAYYDSTSTTFPADEADYASLQERQQIMANLVTQITTIEEQDSLLRLVAMDKPALEAYLDELIRQQDQAQLLEERRATKINQVNVRTGFNTIQDKMGVVQEESSGLWYFYNPSLLGIGQAEFVKEWGTRPLEDNWRLSNKGRDNVNVVTQAHSEEEFQQSTAPAEAQETLAARRNQLWENLPLAPEQQQGAYQQIETAYYNLGKIFNYDLKEFTPTVEAYTSLLDRFPDSEYRPEVLFNLYLLYQNSNADLAQRYRQELIDRYPTSTYAKTVLNPNFQQEEDQISEALKQLYAKAYTLYRGEYYAKADSLLQQGLRQHPSNSFSDNLQLLRILISGHTQGVSTYQQGLEGFIAAHEEEEEESELVPYAKELLQKSYTFAENSAALPTTISYSEDFDQPHYFVAVYKPGKQRTNELLRTLDSYHAKEEAARKLKATNIILTDTKYMVFVSQFSNKTAAMLYFRALERNGVLQKGPESGILEYFVISKDNFSILYNTQDVNAYKAFFQKFYY